MKKIAFFAVLALLIGMLAACNGGGQTPNTTTAPVSTEADYKVTVVDAKGNPYTEGVIVRILSGGEQVSMQPVDGNGSVTKTLTKGEYTVELMFTDSNSQFIYDQTALTMTADKTELVVEVAYGLAGKTLELYHKDGALEAAYVDVCCTQVELTAGQRNYFVFVPKQAGTYEISAIGAVESLGYYGSPHYMSDTTMLPVENNSFTTSIRTDMIGSGEGGTSVLIIGIDPGSASECILSVQRTGDPEWSYEDVPYVVYKTTAKLSPYKLPQGKSLLDFDLTASTDTYKLVLGEDGFYHLNDGEGPLVLVYLGKDSSYMSCYKEVLTKTGVRKYFFDENGEFVKRESYDACLREYFTVMDEAAGVYPLTEDLKYIIQNHGGYNGWWDLDSETSLFQDDAGTPLPDINAEIAWLFMCAYIAQ